MERMTQNAVKLRLLADVQRGYFTAKQAKDIGYSDALHVFHCRKGNWLRVMRGLYRLPSFSDEYPETAISRWTLWSHNREGVSQGVVSHRTALYIHGLLERCPGKIDLSVPVDFRRKPTGEQVVLHKQTLTSDQVIAHTSYRITTPLKSLADSVDSLRVREEVKCVAENALKKGVLTREQLTSLGISSDFEEKYPPSFSPGKKHGKFVGLMIETTGHYHEPFYQALQKNLDRHGLDSMVIDHRRTDRSFVDQVDEVIRMNPEALIISENPAYELTNDYLIRLEDRANRLVLLSSLADRLLGESLFADSVQVDVWLTAYEATRHLIKLGHSRIMRVANTWAYDKSLYRYHPGYLNLLGYRAALEEAGLQGEEILFDESVNHEKTQEALRQILESPGRPTAIYAVSDFRIARHLNVLQELGLRIPDDISLIGTGNTPWSQMPEQPFSSMSLREEEIARLVVERIASRDHKRKSITVEPELVSRESCAPPPTGKGR